MSDVQRDGAIYTVDASERNAGPSGETTYDKGTHFLRSFGGAVRVASREVGDGAKVKELGTGMMMFYEPHDEGGKYRRAAVRERRAFAHG